MTGYALIIVDMVKGNVDTHGTGMMDIEAREMIPVLLDLTRAFRRNGAKVIYACDSFIDGDFIFQSRMSPHSLRGTGGDQPLDELDVQQTDVILPKRRFSAFYKTDLDQTLRTWGVHTVVIAGITTQVCVLMTALDAVQNDFRAVIVSDACTCHKQSIHESVLMIYGNTPMVPLLRTLSKSEVIEELRASGAT
ncbi:MAG: isochorismatase family cysteine hydrolase [Desulfomonilaceae bacterium]|nr:isochorismatase family cysteine hydrolase [Desulfomonilaceae bacterium]